MRETFERMRRREGWKYRRCNSVIDRECPHDCWVLEIGCLCERCGWALRWKEAQEALVEAEEACRAEEERVVDRWNAREIDGVRVRRLGRKGLFKTAWTEIRRRSRAVFEERMRQREERRRKSGEDAP